VSAFFRVFDALARDLPRFLVSAHNRLRLDHQNLAHVLHTTILLLSDPVTTNALPPTKIDLNASVGAFSGPDAAINAARSSRTPRSRRPEARYAASIHDLSIGA
jgi:hypothetical protein